MWTFSAIAKIKTNGIAWFHENRPAARGLLNFGLWTLYIAAAALLLRPVLLTNISADDLINPFSQIYHAGTSIDSVLRRTWDVVPRTGHFNYVGQTFGSIVVMIWTYLIGNFGIRYSLVYATTKFIVFLLCLAIGTTAIKQLLDSLNQVRNIWLIRVTVLVVVTTTLQIHVPWSNDPVASYPLSGFLTAVIGVSYIVLVTKFFNTKRWYVALGVGLFGATTVLYYEFNAFAILAVAPVLVVAILKKLRLGQSVLHQMFISLLFILPAALTTIYFYLTSKASAVNYSGTSLSLSDPFISTFSKGIASALPATSWSIASEWLTGPLGEYRFSLSQYVLGLVLAGVIVLISLFGSKLQNVSRVSVSSSLLGFIPFVIYWFGATFIQTATEKVQLESVRLGHVYNYYAVAALCSAIIFVTLLFLVPWTKANKLLRYGLMSIALTVGGFQYLLNWNVMRQFNGVTSGSSQLLAVYSDKPPMLERCEALDKWKSMGWPEYYWLDMELGLNESYKIFHGEAFCDRTE